MAIRALYAIKDAPLALIVDMYKNAMVPSIAEESQDEYIEMSESLAYDYFATDTVDKCEFVDWMELNNNLKFSERYMKIFRHPLEGIWVAYEALSFVFEFMKDGKAANVQIFSYNGKSFWIGIVNETVIFITPEENEGKKRSRMDKIRKPILMVIGIMRRNKK